MRGVFSPKSEIEISDGSRRKGVLGGKFPIARYASPLRPRAFLCLLNPVRKTQNQIHVDTQFFPQ